MIKIRKTVTNMSALLLMGFSLSAQAANPLLGIIEGANWDLPIVPSGNFFLQSGMVQWNEKDYDDTGRTVPSATGGTTIEGMTRLAHVFSFASLPRVGFFIEAFQPYMSKPTTDGNTITGLGDPLVDLLVYTRLRENLLVGFGNFVSIPVGSNDISNHAWIDIPHIVADYRVGKFGVGGTYALGYLSKVRNGCTPTNGCAEPGDIRSAQMTLRYQATSWLEPFISYISQSQSHGEFTVSSTRFPGSHEEDVGVGARFTIKHGRWLSVWYDAGIDGENAARTNALYFKFVTGL